MPRRQPSSKVTKTNQVRPAHVRGMGDVLFKGFQCLNPSCQRFIFVRKESVNEFFEISCEACGHAHSYGSDTSFFEYRLHKVQDDATLREGDFSILHDDYVNEAAEFKYCLLCCALKPVSHFDIHNGRTSGRQGECRLCKRQYNEVKNPTRTPDQHREAAQKRRLYVELTQGNRIDSVEVYKRFNFKCFKCAVDLSQDVQATSNQRNGNLDHTLPVKFLWPLTTQNATLLCGGHNGEKSGKWPSEFYSDQELRSLVPRTGISYELMAGEAHFNPEAIENLQNPEFVDELLTKHARYMEELIAIRNRILVANNFDWFAVSTTLSPSWIQEADQKLTG